MVTVLRFVDRIDPARTVRMDLNDADSGGYWRLLASSRFDPPKAKRARVSTLLSDGATYPATAYDDRVLELAWLVKAETADIIAQEIQRLARELDRPGNIVEYRAGDQPVFFRTRRVGLDTLEVPDDNTRVDVVVTLLAEPFGYGLREDIGPVTVNNDPAAGSNGMHFDLSGIKGDVETPLILRLANSSPLGAGSLTSAYGVRRRGTPANIPLVLQCESMSLNTDTTLPGNDTVMSGSGSNYARCSFATVIAMTSRVYIARFPSASSVDVRGTYRVFLRKRQSASDPVNVRLGYGGSDLGSVTSNFFNDVVATTGTNRKWVDLGLVSIPASPDPVTDGYSGTELAARGVHVSVEAQRVSGSGNLDLDCLLFVPADDRFGTVKWTTDQGGIDNQVLDGVADAAYALEGTTEVRTTNIPSTRTGGVPFISPGVTNRIVWLVNAGENNLNDDKTHTTAVTVSYWPRYLYLRPVST